MKGAEHVREEGDVSEEGRADAQDHLGRGGQRESRAGQCLRDKEDLKVPCHACTPYGVIHYSDIPRSDIPRSDIPYKVIQHSGPESVEGDRGRGAPSST
jgi:hypothetical protein